MNKLIILFFLIIVSYPEKMNGQTLPVISCEFGNAHGAGYPTYKK